MCVWQITEISMRELSPNICVIVVVSGYFNATIVLTICRCRTSKKGRHFKTRDPGIKANRQSGRKGWLRSEPDTWSVDTAAFYFHSNGALQKVN